MNKFIVLALCCAVFASATFIRQDGSSFVIDQATYALEQLLDDAQQNVADLEANWAVQEPSLEANIATIEQELSNKQAECNNLHDVLNGHQAELQNAQNYVQWLVKRIQENQDHITQILAERCVQNNNFVESLKNDQIALSLVEFLRVQIENKESYDFAQRKAFLKQLNSFLAVYRRGNIDELILLQKQVASDYEVNVNTDTRGRTNEEIGSGHVDNNVGDLALDDLQGPATQSWSDVRLELLTILQDIEKIINDKITQSQQDEIRASVSAASFKSKLEHEIQVYQQELEKWTSIVANLTQVVAQDQANADQCDAEEVALEEQLASAQNDLEVATEQYNHKHANLLEEVEVFTEVLNLYNESTSSQANDFKARADDYLDDGVFQNEEYDAREVPEIDLLDDSDE